MILDTAGPGRELEPEALVVGYAMSRLDQAYLRMTGTPTWREAFRSAGDALEVPPATIKNLRDEFDPLHANPRKGWRIRPMRLGRQKVAAELAGVSDEAVGELALRILALDASAIREAMDSLREVTAVPSAVADREASESV